MQSSACLRHLLSWTDQDDLLLVQCVAAHGASDAAWQAASTATGCSAALCSLRWLSIAGSLPGTGVSLRGRLSWNDIELAILLEAYDFVNPPDSLSQPPVQGSQLCAAMAKILPGRSDAAIKQILRGKVAPKHHMLRQYFSAIQLPNTLEGLLASWAASSHWVRMQDEEAKALAASLLVSAPPEPPPPPLLTLLHPWKSSNSSKGDAEHPAAQPQIRPQLQGALGAAFGPSAAEQTAAAVAAAAAASSSWPGGGFSDSAAGCSYAEQESFTAMLLDPLPLPQAWQGAPQQQQQQPQQQQHPQVAWPIAGGDGVQHMMTNLNPEQHQAQLQYCGAATAAAAPGGRVAAPTSSRAAPPQLLPSPASSSEQLRLQAANGDMLPPPQQLAAVSQVHWQQRQERRQRKLRSLLQQLQLVDRMEQEAVRKSLLVLRATGPGSSSGGCSDSGAAAALASATASPAAGLSQSAAAATTARAVFGSTATAAGQQGQQAPPSGRIRARSLSDCATQLRQLQLLHARPEPHAVQAPKRLAIDRAAAAADFAAGKGSELSWQLPQALPAGDSSSRRSMAAAATNTAIAAADPTLSPAALAARATGVPDIQARLQCIRQRKQQLSLLQQHVASMQQEMKLLEEQLQLQQQELQRCNQLHQQQRWRPSPLQPPLQQEAANESSASPVSVPTPGAAGEAVDGLRSSAQQQLESPAGGSAAVSPVADASTSKPVLPCAGQQPTWCEPAAAAPAGTAAAGAVGADACPLRSSAEAGSQPAASSNWAVANDASGGACFADWALPRVCSSSCLLLDRELLALHDWEPGLVDAGLADEEVGHGDWLSSSFGAAAGGSVASGTAEVAAISDAMPNASGGGGGE